LRCPRVSLGKACRVHILNLTVLSNAALAYGVAWAASCGANVCFIGGAAQVIVYSVLVRYQRKMALEDTQHHAKNLGSKYFAYQVLFGVWSSLVILLVTSSLLFFISGAADCALPLQP